MGFVGDDAEHAVDVIEDLGQALEAVSEDIEGLDDAVGLLPYDLRRSIVHEMVRSAPAPWPVDQHKFEAFAAHEPGQILLQHWGDDAERRLGTLSARLGRIVERGGPDTEAWATWLLFGGEGGLTPREAATALHALSE